MAKRHISLFYPHIILAIVSQKMRYMDLLQMRRVTISIPANIAEGFNKTRPDKARYMNIAQASLNVGII